MNIINFILIYSILTISIIGYGFLFSIKFTNIILLFQIKYRLVLLEYLEYFFILTLILQI